MDEADHGNGPSTSSKFTRFYNSIILHRDSDVSISHLERYHYLTDLKLGVRWDSAGQGVRSTLHY